MAVTKTCAGAMGSADAQAKLSVVTINEDGNIAHFRTFDEGRKCEIKTRCMPEDRTIDTFTLGPLGEVTSVESQCQGDPVKGPQQTVVTDAASRAQQLWGDVKFHLSASQLLPGGRVPYSAGCSKEQRLAVGATKDNPKGIGTLVLCDDNGDGDYLNDGAPRLYVYGAENCVPVLFEIPVSVLNRLDPKLPNPLAN